METPLPEPERLDSWKQIAAYLNKSERTVRRWQETENLPVHKHTHQQRGSVWAYRSELDAWLAGRVIRPEATPVEAGPTSRPLETSRQWRHSWPIGIGLVCLLGFLFVWRTRQPPPTRAPVPLTTLPGAEYGASFSPDGKRFVFHWSQPDSSRSGLYVKSIDDDRVTPLVVSTAAAVASDLNYSPAWSPDGKIIAFLRRTSDDQTWLVLVNANGGSEKRLVRISTGSVLFFANHQHVSWSPDQRWLFVPVALNDQPRGVYRVSAITGEVFPVATGFPAYAPAVSSDGRSLIVLRVEGLPLAFQEVLLYRLNTQGSVMGRPVSIYKGFSVSSGIAWMPDSKKLLLCNSETLLPGPMDTSIFMLPAYPGARLTSVGGDGCNTVAVSSQGVVAFGNASHTRSTMMQMSLQSSEPARAFAASSRFDSYPAFSPDGSRVAFYSNRSGTPGIWIARPDGADLRKIAEHRQLWSKPAWSPDGERLAYVIGRSLTIQPVNNAKATLAIDAGDAIPQFPVWSGDGESLYYTSGQQLWQVRIDGAERRLLAEPGPLIFLVGSVDGSVLFYTRFERRFTLCRRSVDGGSETIIEQGLPFASISVTRKCLYFIRPDMNLYAQPLEGGNARQVGTVPNLPASIVGDIRRWETRFVVSPDDSTVIWALTGPQQTDIERLWLP